MSDVSVVSERIARLLRASGWDVDARRSSIRATEPAYEPVVHEWMAGYARYLSDADIYAMSPARVVVEDGAPEDEVNRIRSALEALERGGLVVAQSRFIDDFWGAEIAVRNALEDAKASEADALLGADHLSVDDRHVSAELRLGSLYVPDHRAIESGLPMSGSCMVILADAGLGKSELLRWHAWRSAVLYRASSESRRPVPLPPVFLRVPLRDFKSLSLDYIAHQLSQPANISGQLPLPQIRSGAVLRELLVQQRLTLFLDGLDEVSADSQTIDTDIIELRRVVRDGGSFVLSCREGHESSRGAVARRFEPDEIARLTPLERGVAHELLRKRGATELQSSQVTEALSGPSSGIPLFLLLAHRVGLDTAPSAAVRASRTLTLLELLKLFCERDESRVGVTSDLQIDMLTQIAEHLMVVGSVDQEELLRSLGIGDGDPLARVVRNPHALLENGPAGIQFKFGEFEALFSARAISEGWRNYGFRSISSILMSEELGELVVECLARLLHPAGISGAWVSSESQSDTPLLRRNLLGIALAHVNDIALGQSPNSRAAALADVLGNRRLVNVSLANLYLDRLDFSDWHFERVQGNGGVLSYCENLWRTKHDDSVLSVEADGCSFDPPAAAVVDLASGIARLRRIVRPIRRKNGGPVVALMDRDEVTDLDGWHLLTRLGLASFGGRASTARWTLNADGVRVLTAFSIADGRGDDSLATLMESDQDVRSIVSELARR